MRRRFCELLVSLSDTHCHRISVVEEPRVRSVQRVMCIEELKTHVKNCMEAEKRINAEDSMKAAKLLDAIRRQWDFLPKTKQEKYATLKDLCEEEESLIDRRKER